MGILSYLTVYVCIFYIVNTSDVIPFNVCTYIIFHTESHVINFNGYGNGVPLLLMVKVLNRSYGSLTCCLIIILLFHVFCVYPLYIHHHIGNITFNGPFINDVSPSYFCRCQLTTIENVLSKSDVEIRILNSNSDSIARRIV